VEHTALVNTLARVIENADLESVPGLIGDLGRLQALLWTRLLGPTRNERSSGVGRSEAELHAEPVDWLSTASVILRFGLTERWLADHRRQLRLRGIVSKPSRKTTLYHARRLARFLDERSRP